MSHLSIPHTIKRGNTYHFNLRHKSSIVRRSLRTSCRIEALELVSKILSEIKLQGSKSIMDKVALDKIVRDTIDKHLERVGCMFGENNSFGDMLFKTYQNEALHQQFTYMYESDASLPTYYKYKIQECFPKTSPDVSISNVSYKLFIRDAYDPDAAPTPDIEDLDRNYFEMGEKLEIFFGQIERIKKLLLSGNFDAAKNSYQLLKNTQEKSLLFSEVSRLFIEAGKNGALPITKSYTGEPWNTQNLKNNEHSIKIFDAHFGEQLIKDIDSAELDLFFREILVNFPKGNVSPYNKMSPNELIECAVGGKVDDEHTIGGKNVFEHFKKLKTLFNFYLEELKGSDKAIKGMRYKVKNEQRKRGRFSKRQVAKILKCVDELGDGKKWPVNIMAFTGMRNAEVMQLRKEDIRKSEEGIWYFKVTEAAGKLKTEQSNRVIPIHEQLLKKGFLEFVDSTTEKYLFRRFSQSDKYLTRIYSNHIKPSCNLPDERENGEILNLYSLRHFVVTTLVEEDASLPYIQSMIGHLQSADRSETIQVYTHTDSMKKKQQIINLITLDAKD